MPLVRTIIICLVIFFTSTTITLLKMSEVVFMKLPQYYRRIVFMFSYPHFEQMSGL